MNWLLCFSICVLSAASFGCEIKEHYTPVKDQALDAMLYRITDCDQQTQDSYVFGTFHTSDNEIIQRIDYVLPYIDSSRTALFELTKGSQDPSLIAQYMFLPAQSKGLEEIIGEEDFNALVALLEDSPTPIAAPYLNRYKPWAASVMAQISLVELSGEVVDDKLQRIAYESGKEVVALEDMKSQFESFNVLSQDEQIQALRDTIYHFDRIKHLNYELKTAYLQQHLFAVNAAGEASFSMINNEEIARKLENSLVVERNKNMVKHMLPHIQKGSSFTAIGALHLPQPHGVLQRLENEGYYIQPVKP